MKILTAVTASLISFILLLNISRATPDSPTAPDILFILQTEAGLTAHTTLTSTVSLDHARQLFSVVEDESADYIHGEYILAGRSQSVKLAIGKTGWIVAYHTPDYASQNLIDCTYDFDINKIINRPEKAVLEVAAALGFSPSVDFYDFRHPEANGIALHWMYLYNSGTANSTMTLPISNLYIERGYAFCTAMTNSELWLNSELIDRQGGVTQVIYRWGTLSPGQLRAGQTNALEISALSLFGHGLLAGVSTEYFGPNEIVSSGGHNRNIILDFPTFLGEPLTISKDYLPIVKS